MKFYKCDPSWPVCLYDFTFRNLNPQFNTYRVNSKLDSFVIDDYFQADPSPAYVQIFEKKNYIEANLCKNLPLDDLLI